MLLQNVGEQRITLKELLLLTKRISTGETFVNHPEIVYKFQSNLGKPATGNLQPRVMGGLGGLNFDRCETFDSFFELY